MNELQEAYNLLSNASLEQILSAMPMVLTLIFIAGTINYWLDKKGYEKAKERFEQQNPHLKGKYFTFYEWWKNINEDNTISNKIYEKKFGSLEKVQNTDSINLPRKIKSLKGKVKLGRIIALLVLIGSVIYAFFTTYPDASKEIWQGMYEANRKAKQ